MKALEHLAQMFMTSVILFALGALNACLAITATTCTQGDAGSLGGGVPIALIVIWHSIFAVRFFIGYWFQDMSACSAMTEGFSLEHAGENMDGSEPYYTVIWLATSLAFWIGLYRGFRSSRLDDS